MRKLSERQSVQCDSNPADVAPLLPAQPSPVRGAALLNLGRFKDAAKVFSKLLKTGGDARFHLDMHSVKLFARAKSEGLGDHEKAGKDLLKYCKSRFSPKRRSRSERRGSALEAFDCFETAGVAFTRAGRADQAAAAFDMALRIPDAKSQDFRSNFAPGSFEFRPPPGNIVKVSDLKRFGGKGTTRSLSVRVLSQAPGPTVFVIDNFLTSEEQAHLRLGMRRSKQAAHREGSADPLLCFSNVHPLRGELMEAGSGKKSFWVYVR